MYKDKAKQKEANRKASQRRRQGMTQEGAKGMTEQGMTEGMTELGLTVESMKPSERELWDKHSFDCRTPVYLECLARQKQG